MNKTKKFKLTIRQETIKDRVPQTTVEKGVAWNVEGGIVFQPDDGDERFISNGSEPTQTLDKP